MFHRTDSALRALPIVIECGPYAKKTWAWMTSCSSVWKMSLGAAGSHSSSCADDTETEPAPLVPVRPRSSFLCHRTMTKDGSDRYLRWLSLACPTPRGVVLFVTNVLVVNNRHCRMSRLSGRRSRISDDKRGAQAAQFSFHLSIFMYLYI